MGKPQKKHDPSQEQVMPEVAHQTLNGGGNMFHLDQLDGAGAGVVSHADAALTQSAFTPTITTGANIQFNSATIQASGHDPTDDHHTL